VDAAGNVLVVDAYNHCVQKFNGEGVFLTRWGVKGADEGQMRYPASVAVDDSGYVYVSDSDNNRVQRFAPHSDADGISDPIEGTADADGDGTPNYLDMDSDGDGIGDDVEAVVDTDHDGTPDFLETDSDGDGISDAVETAGDTDHDGTPNYLDSDSDGDGIGDAVETGVDSDGDGIPNSLDLDSDGDSLPDAWEVAHGLDPLSGAGINGAAGDPDGDGVPNGLEYARGLDPTVPDAPPAMPAPAGWVLIVGMMALMGCGAVALRRA
jgi:hypothetical protein